MSEPAETRVARYLTELRDDPPAPKAELAPTIVRRARWQQALRTPARAVGALTAALGDGLALVLGLRKGRGPR
jgi:hypothetical protein